MGSYVIKVWLTSVIGSPILLAIVSFIETASDFRPGDLGLFLVMFLFGAIFSLPSIILFYFSCRLSIDNIDNIFALKGLLSAIGLLLTYLPFLVINGFHPVLSADQLPLKLFLMYGSMIIVGIWVYRIKPLPAPTENLSETIDI